MYSLCNFATILSQNLTIAVSTYCFYCHTVAASITCYDCNVYHNGTCPDQADCSDGELCMTLKREDSQIRRRCSPVNVRCQDGEYWCRNDCLVCATCCSSDLCNNNSLPLLAYNGKYRKYSRLDKSVIR